MSRDWRATSCHHHSLREQAKEATGSHKPFKSRIRFPSPSTTCQATSIFERTRRNPANRETDRAKRCQRGSLSEYGINRRAPSLGLGYPGLNRTCGCEHRYSDHFYSNPAIQTISGVSIWMGKLSRLKESILRDIEAFKTVALSATSIADIGRKYGFPENGKTIAWLRPILAQVGISEESLKENRSRSKTLYPWITKECPICHTGFKSQKGHPKETSYCSQTCANRAPRPPRSKEMNDRISRKLIERADREGRPSVTRKATQERACAFCSKSFLPKLNKTRYCSQSCSAKSTAQNPEFREKLRQIQLKRIADGKHSGWKSRAKVNTSYAERFFMKVLGLNHIEYQHELPESGYFIDFAIILTNGHKIALEIDGRQHKQPERAASDARKDESLRKTGWHVHRIPWCSINSETGKQRMKAEIDGFLTVYRSLLNSSIF